MSATRIYLVTDADTADQRLVRAATAAQAIRYCASRFQARPVSVEEAIELRDKKVPVEGVAAAQETDDA